MASLRRFSADADEATRKEFGRSMLETLDEIGIAPGEDFVVGHPDVMDPTATDLAPFARKSEASRDAALQNYPKGGSQRERVLLAVARAGPHGATRDELAQLLDLGDSTVDARVWELKRGGFVADTELQRETSQGGKASVLILSEKARVVLGHEMDERDLALW